MQINTKIFISMIILLIGMNLYTYISMIKNKETIFLNEIALNTIIFNAIENDKILQVKSLLVNDINRLFFEASKVEDINSYIKICKYFNKENLKLFSTYDSQKETLEKNTYLYKLDKKIKIGRKKIRLLCNY